MKTEYTQTMVITGAMEVVEQGGKSRMHEELVVPPVYVANTKAETLLFSLLRDLAISN